MRGTDSPRWCDRCEAWGDHHTDRHPTLREAAQAVVDAPYSPHTPYVEFHDALCRLRAALASGESERSDEIRLPGLQCENCGRVCYDVGGGRACYGGSGGPGERCGTMRGVWLRAVVGELRT